MSALSPNHPQFCEAAALFHYMLTIPQVQITTISKRIDKGI